MDETGFQLKAWHVALAATAATTTVFIAHSGAAYPIFRQGSIWLFVAIAAGIALMGFLDYVKALAEGEWNPKTFLAPAAVVLVAILICVSTGIFLAF